MGEIAAGLSTAAGEKSTAGAARIELLETRGGTLRLQQQLVHGHVGGLPPGLKPCQLVKDLLQDGLDTPDLLRELVHGG